MPRLFLSQHLVPSPSTHLIILNSYNGVLWTGLLNTAKMYCLPFLKASHVKPRHQRDWALSKTRTAAFALASSWLLEDAGHLSGPSVIAAVPRHSLCLQMGCSLLLYLLTLSPVTSVKGSAYSTVTSSKFANYQRFSHIITVSGVVG